jgi:hypothetical protein
MMDTAAKLRYAELRKQGAALPDIARVMNLPEDELRNFSREMELWALDFQRLSWELERDMPIIEAEMAMLMKELES